MSVSGTPAQQEAALKKLEGERDRLVAEVLTLQEALSTRQACEELVKYVESTPEPFAEGGQTKDNPNPWNQQVSVGSCCVVT